jgi:hypothetical protein
MEKYFTITKEEAEQIGRFTYSKSEDFDPFVGEQKDGTFLVSDKMVSILNAHPKFSKINFIARSKKDRVELDFKESDILAISVDPKVSPIKTK